MFNATTPDVADRRATVSGKNVEWLSGLGWFLLPNPVYGSALPGSFNAVFPNDKPWSGPGDPAPNPVPAPVSTTTNGRANRSPATATRWPRAPRRTCDTAALSLLCSEAHG